MPDENNPGWKRSVKLRVRCVNSQCEDHLDQQIVKVERIGNVLLLTRFLCYHCLCEMEVVSKKLRSAFEL